MNSAATPPTSRSYRGLKAAERKALRRENLIEAGVDIIGNRGYAQTTVKDLCRRAGVSERYFYESFANKEELLSAVYQHVTDRLRDGFIDIMNDRGSNSGQRGQDATRMFLKHVSDPVLARIQLQEILGVSDGLNREYQRAMTELGEFIGLAMRMVFPDIPAEKFASGVVGASMAGAVIQVANNWVYRGYDAPLDELAEEMYALLLSSAEKLSLSGEPGQQP